MNCNLIRRFALWLLSLCTTGFDDDVSFDAEVGFDG